ncbi:hypothetical protein ATANTOWER_017747 [Ataeniobius toweri]|uniref:Uncharacterized protein n=1 Tax=Ataeniobius toweri TaxID=208326 RepID=A0ABU7BU18_9TELE|nr:hypothetical protein [Ataeniobius toweri]
MHCRRVQQVLIQLVRSYTFPGSVFSCCTFLEEGIGQATAASNLAFSMIHLALSFSIYPCFSPRRSY